MDDGAASPRPRPGRRCTPGGDRMTTAEDDGAARLRAAGDFISGVARHLWFLASAGARARPSIAASNSLPSSPTRRDEGRYRARPLPSSFTGSASPTRRLAARRGAAGLRARARDLRRTRPPRRDRLLAADELRDVALTYEAATAPCAASSRPRPRRRSAAPAARSGRVSRRGSPGSAASCSTAAGTRRTAILRDLPDPGNSYLGARSPPRARLARHRGEPEIAWEEIRPLFPEGPATEPGDIIHQEGLFLQRLAAGLCLDAGDLPGARPGWRRTTAGSPGAGACSAGGGQLAWARYHRAAGDRARPAHADDALALAATPRQPLVLLAAHRSSANSRPRPAIRLKPSAPAAALDLADACEAPFERALTLLALAELRAATAHPRRRASATRSGISPRWARRRPRPGWALAAVRPRSQPGRTYPLRLTAARGRCPAPAARRTNQRGDRGGALHQPRTVSPACLPTCLPNSMSPAGARPRMRIGRPSTA